jgi:hypothetical protein
MLLFDGAFGLIVFALWIFCIIDVITTPDGSVRNLPKMAWLFIVIALFDIGAIVWLVAGRDWNRTSSRLPYKGNRGVQPGAPEWVRRGYSNPDDDEEFQARLRARAEEQRRRAREANGEPGADAASE